MNTRKRLMKIDNIINEKDFLTNKQLSNEVGYYVFDYPPEDELIVREYIQNLSDKNKKTPQGYTLKVYDFYDLMIEKLIEEDYLEMCYKMEKEYGFNYLAESIYDLLELDYRENFYTDYVEKNTPDNAVIFITGIGKIYPFIRAHGILNKLHQIFDRTPVVLFYPGKYDGLTLKLFNEFNDENYYRAFSLVKED